MAPDTLLLLGIAAAGGVGSMLRYVLGETLTFGQRVKPRSLPGALLLINISGSVLAGGVIACAAVLPDGQIAAVLLAGLFGGYTTFGAVSQEVVGALRVRRWGVALLVGPGQVVLGVCGAWFGHAVVQLLAT